MALTPEDIKVLVSSFEASDWAEMSVRIGDTTLELTRTGRPPEASAARPSAAAPASPAPAAVVPAAVVAPAAAVPAVAVAPVSSATAPAIVPEGHAVRAPSLGLFWLSLIHI